MNTPVPSNSPPASPQPVVESTPPFTPPSAPSTPPPPVPPSPPENKSFQVVPRRSLFSKIARVLLVLVAFVALGAAAFFAARFFGNRTGPTESATIVYWGLWESENIIQPLIDEYQADHPGVKIEYERQSHEDYRERLQNALAGGSGPDIFRFHNTWTPMYKAYLATLPDSIMNSSVYEKTFYPVTQKDLKLEGKYVGIPLMIDTILLYVNDDLLQVAGKSAPREWDELLNTANELKQGGVLGAALGNSSNVDHWQDILALLMIQNGTDMKRVGSTIGSDGKNLGGDALAYYTLFTSPTYRIWDETLPRSTDAFASGRLALYFGPSWQTFEFLKNSNLHFTAHPTPLLDDIETHYATYWAEGVWEKSPHKDEAWQFLKFLSERESIQKLYEAQSQTRAFGEPPSRVDMAGDYQDVPVVSAVLASAPKAVSWYLASYTWDGDTGLNSRLGSYFSDAINAANQTTAPADALITAEQGVAQIFSQYAIVQ